MKKINSILKVDHIDMRLWVKIGTWRLQGQVSHMSLFWYLIHLPWSMLKGSRSLDFTQSTAEFTDPRIWFNAVWLYLCKSKLVFHYLRMSVSSCCPYLHLCFIKKKKNEHRKLSNWNSRFSPALDTLQVQLLPPWLTYTCGSLLQWNCLTLLETPQNSHWVSSSSLHYLSLPMTRKRTVYTCFDVHDNCYYTCLDHYQRITRNITLESEVHLRIILLTINNHRTDKYKHPVCTLVIQ